MSLLTDLAIILMAAGVFTVISKALKQPLILGYTIAGFLVGPYLGLFPISSIEGVKQWADIGIIFLLFALGLEFSFKKALRVGRSALITACVQCAGMFAVGMIVGPLMGWTLMESVFLGGLLSMSNTAVIIKAYNDFGFKNKPYANLLFGSLVFDDIIAVFLLMLLSTLAAASRFTGIDLVFAFGKFAFFLILWFVVGILIIPSLLKRAHKYLNKEIIVVIAIGLCFLMVTLAQMAGFSAALGAFVMGSILAETIEGERILQSMDSINDLFGAIFFVSVGMMVDPVMIAQHWLPIVILSLVVMIGIFFFATVGALLTGQGINGSVHIGFSLAQLGIGAFIVIEIGCSMGVMRDFICPVVVATSVITTFFTPYMIKAADPVCDWLYRVLPPKLISTLDSKANATALTESVAAQNEWKNLLKIYNIRLLLYSVIILAIIIFSNKHMESIILGFYRQANPVVMDWICFGVTAMALLPFFYGLISSSKNERRSIELLIKSNRNNKWVVSALTIVKILISLAALFFTINCHLAPSWFTILLMLLFAVSAVIVAQKYSKRFSAIENKFISNFNEKEQMERAVKPVTTSLQDKLQGYDVHIEYVEISPSFTFVGKTLREMPFRHMSDISIVEIMHGERCVRIPRGDEPIFPHDILLAVGTTEQLQKFRSIIAENSPEVVPDQKSEFVVRILNIEKDSILVNKTLKENDLRSSGCLVVSILRNNKLIANPKYDEKILEGDRIWIAGEKNSCEWFI